MIGVFAPSAFGISPKYDKEIWNADSKSGCRIWWRGCAVLMKTKNIQPIMIFSLPKFDALYTQSAYEILSSHLGRAGVGRRLEALSAETGRLEEIYWQKVESLEELKRSVLAKAFSGEL